MNLIACVDKDLGLSFNGRRQSRDRAVVARILALSGSARLLMSPASQSLFAPAEHLVADPNFLTLAKAGDFCFLEQGPLPTENVERVFLFHWNRAYPADCYFTLDLGALRRVSREDFAGHSHKKITLEIYEGGAV